MLNPIRDPEVLEGYNGDALGFRGSPEGLFRPNSEAEVADILRSCQDSGTPLTPVGFRSSTTGSCVASRGYLLSCERLCQGPDIRPEIGRVVAGPGHNLGELKTTLEEAGLFFPPDPTSERDCCLGGAAATNASGARTLKYGSMRHWISRIRVVLPTGEILELRAGTADKNATGYFGFQDPIQFFLGSEGTLGVLTELELKVLPLPQDYLALCAMFPGEAETLAAATEIRRRGLPVRCLEYFDGACLSLLRREKHAPLPPGAGGMLYLEEEVARDSADSLLAKWLPILEELGAQTDDTIVGDTRHRKAELRALRHDIPATLNERGIAFRRTGGLKISTDWAVSYEQVAEAIADSRDICRKQGVEEVYCFGHIGNGHPHLNLLVPDEEMAVAAHDAVREICRRVGSIGGTVSAEHGIGKVKKAYLPYFLPPRAIDWMRAFKRNLDPAGICAPGNIFD